MVRQIIICIVIALFTVLFYNYSVNYITGKLELDWLKHGIETNWNLRLIIILCVVGGGAGFVISRVIKTIRKKS